MFSALLHRHAAPRLWVAAVVLFSGVAWAQPAALNVLAGGAPGQEVKTPQMRATLLAHAPQGVPVGAAAANYQDRKSVV